MKKKIIISVFLCFLGLSVFAQKINVYIDQIINNQFPKMETFVSVTENSEALMSLVPGNFAVFVDGKKIESKLSIAGFQYSDIPISYAVLVSANGLMEGEILAEQQKAVVNLIESLREKDTISVYYFGDEIKTLFENRKKDENLSKELEKIETLGSNPKLYDALVYSARKLALAKEKRKVLIVLSDGRDIESKYTQDQFLQIIDEQNIPMYGCGIYFMGGRNLSVINNMANHTGGGYTVAVSPRLLSGKLMELSDRVMHGYIVNFKAGIDGDDQFHQMQVVVNKDGKEASFHKNFIAIKIPFPFWLKIVFIVIGIIIVAGLIVLFIILKRMNRKKMGITKRRCPDCKRRMKDDWDDCPFCKYLPKKDKKKKKDKEKEEKKDYA